MIPLSEELPLVTIVVPPPEVWLPLTVIPEGVMGL